jgi:hypothetical protein
MPDSIDRTDLAGKVIDILSRTTFSISSNRYIRSMALPDYSDQT